MDNHILFLISIMLAAGAFGGLINYFQEQDDTSPTSADSTNLVHQHHILHCLTIGIGAALLVPLFLNMISSDLLIACKETPTKMLVFAGFCLIAAISSRSFIGTLSNRVIDMVKKVEKEAERANLEINAVKKEVQPVIQKATEPMIELSSDNAALQDTTVNGENNQVLLALSKSQYAFRTLAGISNFTKLSQDKVKEAIQELMDAGLVNENLQDGGKYWCLTKQGKEVASHVNSPQLLSESS